MGNLTVDFELPIGLLIFALICVLLVRAADNYGVKRAKKKTRDLVNRFGMQNSGQASSD